MVGRSKVLQAVVAALMGVAVLAASGCQLRRESAPSAVPTATQAVLDRDSLAVALSQVADVATAMDAQHADDAAQVARAQLDAVGGVYVAFPEATPSPHAEPTSTPVSLDSAIAAVRVLAEQIAASTDDANLAHLATSIDLAWAIRQAWYSRSASGLDGVDGGPDSVDDATSPAPPTGPFPLPHPDGTPGEAVFVPGLDSAISGEDIARLSLRHDQARFVYQTMAAVLFAQERDVALDRADAHAARSRALAALTDAPDERTAMYQLRDVTLLDADSRQALVRDVEHDLALEYTTLALAATAQDRQWLLTCAYDAYVEAMGVGLGVTDLPALPGLVLTQN